ncbi:hypothetical protein [Olivibacter sp. XZL3]|uniref:hypothetical protein n=1 Tax=Olivibacter sp. XZL3 TaxID=1735116 RepID=UPI001065057F|nr:hypothetical protein [Olivibacter sp. XZL3]
MKKILLFILCCGTFLLSKAQQEFEWQVKAFGFADNREYLAADLYSQSILGMRFAPEVGLRIDSTHRLRFGVNFLQEFGAEPFGEKVNPIVYYNYENKGLSFYLGAFPRFELLGDYPRAVLNDTLMYYRPNIEGLFFRYRKGKFHQQVWVDWTSRQTAEKREQFMVGLSGKATSGLLFFSHYLSMLHTANTTEGDFPVRDNMVALLQVGADLSDRWVLDSLTIAAGALGSLDRIRGEYDTRTPKGFIADLHAAYKSWFVHNTFYKGQAHDVLFGDRFYTKDSYDRLDLGWRPFRKGNVEGFFMFSLHFTPGEVSNQQMIQLRYNIGY